MFSRHIRGVRRNCKRLNHHRTAAHHPEYSFSPTVRPYEIAEDEELEEIRQRELLETAEKSRIPRTEQHTVFEK